MPGFPITHILDRLIMCDLFSNTNSNMASCLLVCVIIRRRTVRNIYIVVNVDHTKPIAKPTPVTEQLLVNHTKQFYLSHQELYMFSIHNVLQEGVCDQVSSSLFTK